MTLLVRLLEKLTGSPHRHDNASRVRTATAQLSHTVDDFSATLKQYETAPDPLVALLTDVFNQRQLASKYNGRNPPS